MKYDDFDNRMYAKWSDVVPPVQAIIEAVRVEEMSRTKDNVLVVWFPKDQFRYGVPLTAKCNRRALAAITGSENPMDAIGVTVELYADMTVRNPQTGELGALRIRAPQKPDSGKSAKPKKPKPHRPVKIEEPDSDGDKIPY